MGWQFWIDRGGTFTDIVAVAPDGALTTHKLLSASPERYRDATVAGIKQVLGLLPEEPIPAGVVDVIKMGTTVATNALLERKGARTLLVVNRGFADLLAIGTQARPRLFDLDIRLPQQLYAQVYETGARVTVEGREIEMLDVEAARAAFKSARAAGIDSCAIALIHAWQYPAHEQELARLAREAGFEHVSVSHEVSALLGLVARAATTVVDAYLSPVLRRYVDELAAEVCGTRLLFMQSNGGLVDARAFQGKDAVLSGPAGGIVGAARTAAHAGVSHIIGFDMGGTSTDVAVYAGAFERTFDAEVAGVRVRAPMMAIHSVAAGGGSILRFDGARFRVGPDSAGAAPGPACYRRGGPLTVTDANVCVGKIQPRHFPHIFGANGDQPIDAAIVRERFAALAAAIGSTDETAPEPRAIAEGFLRVAVSHMANAIKQVSLEKGHDVGGFALQCFGGAAGQHACLVAEELGMQRILIHPLAGVLSAYGMGLADQSLQREQAIERPFDPAVLAYLEEVAARLSADARAALIRHGITASTTAACHVHLQYAGADSALPVPLGSCAEMHTAFTAAHRLRFGFATPERDIRVALIAVEVTAASAPVHDSLRQPRSASALQPIDEVDLWMRGRAWRAPVYERAGLCPQDVIRGPALITETIATTVIEPGWCAEVNAYGHLVLLRTDAAEERQPIGIARADPVLLELFNNLFMNVAEQMGAVLQNTSSSVNMRERLDFSCAIFDSAGHLIANAPHVPVHLGAMGESVQIVIKSRGTTLTPGDVVVLNNPFNGGTHLPDLTVVTPVFDSAGQKILFFVGNRGHHADIGGTTPGSTPPGSTRLMEEGVVIDDFLLVAAGVFHESAFRQLLTTAAYPARNPDMNVADIKAQIAANACGVRELNKMAARYGADVVAAYMRHVMDNGEECIRRAITTLTDGAFDYVMDDGAPLRVAVRINRDARAATIDFSGTGAQHRGNFNAPPAVVRAVVLYAFRCLSDRDIPLNEGCLRPITIVLPAGTFLSPEPGSAVVAGNTEVSQAACNALFGALKVCASAQATMNNFLFGDQHRQYYETICGGAGAGPGFDGASAVHTHMTNTRITDPEVLELRYPVRVVAFAIRRGSGGAGARRGGDGVVRRIRFAEPMTAVLVSSRRTVAPHGLRGGASGARGRQWIERADGSIELMAGIDQKELAAGDEFVVETPGGGGYGAPRNAGN
ncbi:MAG TPA: hydantoinase B/oxoprolinase family protein [Steroidobacteraceae bacterium]